MAKAFQIHVIEAHALVDFHLAKASDADNMGNRLEHLDRIREIAAFIELRMKDEF